MIFPGRLGIVGTWKGFTAVKRFRKGIGAGKKRIAGERSSRWRVIFSKISGIYLEMILVLAGPGRSLRSATCGGQKISFCG
jgi:hypothetical protein